MSFGPLGTFRVLGLQTIGWQAYLLLFLLRNVELCKACCVGESGWVVQQ
jgi:hypothetical protein